MRIISFCIVFLFSVLCGCKFKSNEITSVSKSVDKMVLIDSSSEISLLTGKEINSIFSYFSKGENDYLAAETGDSVTVFSMNTGGEILSIPIPSVMLEDSLGETSLKSICLNDTNDLFFISKKLIVRNNNGIISKREINFNRGKYLLYNLQNDHPVFDESTGKLYLQKYSTAFAQNDPGFYKTAVLSSLNWNTGEEEDIAVGYPQNYVSNYYGFANHVYFSSNKKNTVLSFAASSDFFIFNRIENRVDTIKGKSLHQNAEPAVLPKTALESRRDKMQHWYSIPEYHETLLDANNGFIYRFFLNGQDLKRPDGTYNTYWDKQFLLMVFDEKNQMIAEYDLTNRGYDLFFSFPGSNKLYMMQSSAQKTPTFKIFKFLK